MFKKSSKVIIIVKIIKIQIQINDIVNKKKKRKKSTNTKNYIDYLLLFFFNLEQNKYLYFLFIVLLE